VTAPERWRVGQCWSAKGGLTTVVEVGRQPADEQGRRPDDRLVGVMETPELARFVVAAVNGPDSDKVSRLEAELMRAQDLNKEFRRQLDGLEKAYERLRAKAGGRP
jgi:hypothetical protein